MTVIPDNAARFVHLAVIAAAANVERGQRPYGALVVLNGEIIGEGVNTVLADNDPTAHAEVAAVRDACVRTGRRDLAGALLFASCHPCGMCQQVAQLTGIDTVLYAGRCASSGPVLPELSIRLLADPDVNRPFEAFDRLGLPVLDRP